MQQSLAELADEGAGDVRPSRVRSLPTRHGPTTRGGLRPPRMVACRTPVG